MRHLAIFMHDLAGGGVERMRLALIGAFLGRGMRVSLLLHRRAGELAGAVPIGCEVVELGGRTTLGDVPALARWLRAERPDLLMSSLDHNNVAALLAARLARTGVPVVVCQHNALSAEAGTMGWRYRAVPALYRLLTPRAAGIVAVSEGVADDMARAAGIARERITVIHNPVIGAGFAARAAEALPEEWARDPWVLDRSVPLLVSAGRLVAQKDPEALLRAFALLPAHARLLLLGRGELEGRLEALVAELGLTDRVRLAGFQQNPLPFVARADAFVLSSRYEGLGNVLVEALGCGTPVASTDCPHGPSEILEGGRWGALAPVGDARALAEAMLRALREAPPAEALRARAAQFTAERAVGRHLSLFEGALAGAAPRARSAARAGAPAAGRRVFGLTLSALDVDGVAGRVVGEAPPGVGLVVTPNTDHVRRLRADRAFARAYAAAAVVTADGFPVQLYARLRGAGARRVTGCDLLAAVLRHPGLGAHRPFFVADSEETVAGLRLLLRRRGMEGRAGFRVPPVGFERDAAEGGRLAEAIAAHGTTLLLMGVGAPRSEVFVHENRERLPPCWALCVGQALRVEAGLTRRAPRLLRGMNLEWAWRLAQEPRRLAGRYATGVTGFTGAMAADLRGGFDPGGRRRG